MKDLVSFFISRGRRATRTDTQSSPSGPFTPRLLLCGGQPWNGEAFWSDNKTDTQVFTFIYWYSLNVRYTMRIVWEYVLWALCATVCVSSLSLCVCVRAGVKRERERDSYVEKY